MAPSCAATMGWLLYINALVWKIVQFALLIMVITKTAELRDEWLQEAPADATVRPVAMEGFWGPVQVIVPKNCHHNHAEERRLVSPAAEVRPPLAKEAERALRLPAGAQPLAWAPGRFLAEHPEKNEEEGSDAARHGEEESDTAHHHAESQAVHDMEELRQLGPQAVHDTEEARRLAGGASSKDSSKDLWGRLVENTRVVIHRCHEDIALWRPSELQNYFAMIWLSGRDDMEELRAWRCTFFWVIAIGCVFELLGQLGWELNQAKASTPELSGYTSMPPGEPETVQQQKASPCPQLFALCMFPGEVITKFFTIQSQIAIPALFFMFWHDDYYVMSFLPGEAYLALLSVYPVGLVAAIISCICGPGNPVTSLIMCLVYLYGVALYVAIIFPLTFGYAWFQMNFLWNTIMSGVATQLTFGTLSFNSGAEYLENETLASESKVVGWLVAAHLYEVVAKTVIKSLTCR